MYVPRPASLEVVAEADVTVAYTTGDGWPKAMPVEWKVAWNAKAADYAAVGQA